ncbi:MAG: oligosaccharide flippase family protein, partial [Clostridiales bacterium]|nr:oligosaccharide flippase family protein [Clostridiales bacterium]
GVLELASSAHMLWIAPVTAGLPMAVSTETAAGRGGEALHAGRRLALRVSLLMLPALFVFSPLIARLLGDARTLPALWCYLPCLPVLGLSAVYNGWCYGAGDTLPPAASELTEQALRFALCMGLLTVFPRMRAAYTAAVPALSTLLGEGAGLLLVVWMLKKQGTLPAGRASAETEKKLWRLSAPMTWMRLSNTLTRTAGAVLIPLRLRAAGLSAQEATARLGMLSGMAMPWVMLPGVFTGALAVVAGPAIARRRNSPEMLRALAVRLIAAALAISAPLALLLSFGAPFLANVVYRQADVGPLLKQLAPLAPLCGAQQVLSGILTGMEMQRSLLASSLSGSLLTLVLDFFLVKKFRLAGCALARLAGHGLTLYMNLCAFSAELRKRRDVPTPPLKG